MEQNKKSLLFKDINLIFVYVVIFIFGLITVFVMTNIINDKVDEINKSVLA